MKIAVATKNKGKIEEIKEILKDCNLDIVSLDYEDIEENGKTFEENSLIKAKGVKQYTKYPVLSDDSGLMIDCFDGWPGVFTARVFNDKKSQYEKNQALIDKMKDQDVRNAKFKCVLTYISEKDEVFQFVGESCGEITHDIEGDKGHGYDPIFFSYDLNKSFGNSTVEEKNKVSHRGRAFEKFISFITKRIDE